MMDGCRLIPEFFVQIKDKLEKVIAKQHELTEKWDKHWEVLQQCEYTHTRSHRYSVVSGGQRAFFCNAMSSFVSSVGGPPVCTGGCSCRGMAVSSGASHQQQRAGHQRGRS